MKKNQKLNPNYEAWKKVRGDWGSISPVTKIIRNKKKDTRLKYPKKEIEKEDN